MEQFPFRGTSRHDIQHQSQRQKFFVPERSYHPDHAIPACAKRVARRIVKDDHLTEIINRGNSDLTLKLNKFKLIYLPSR